MSFNVDLQHFVWSTAHRELRITFDWADRLYQYIGGMLHERKCMLLAANGMPDHIHLLISMHATASKAQLANALKSVSSKWIHQNIDGQRDFRWQKDYASFSVSLSQKPRVNRYIKNQHQHHQKLDFKSEYLELLTRHGIEFDERYLWD
jgi:putative transposase